MCYWICSHMDEQSTDSTSSFTVIFTLANEWYIVWGFRYNKYSELNWFENVYDHHHEKNIVGEQKIKIEQLKKLLRYAIIIDQNRSYLISVVKCMESLVYSRHS